MERMMSKRSMVHPTYKTKYRVTNWPEYDRALVRRGVSLSYATEMCTLNASVRPGVVAGVWRLVNTINPGRRTPSTGTADSEH